MTRPTVARDAAVFADVLARHLLEGSSAFAGAELRRECLVAAFRVWPALMARMVELGASAPEAREEGCKAAAALRDIINAAGEAP